MEAQLALFFRCLRPGLIDATTLHPAILAWARPLRFIHSSPADMAEARG